MIGKFLSAGALVLACSANALAAEEVKYPGNSVNPIDKGKTVATDTFKYTLEDVRQDGSSTLILLTAENITKKTQPVSQTDIRLWKTPTPTLQQYYSPDFFYDRRKCGAELKDNLEAGKKLKGYSILNLRGENPKKLFLVFYNLDPSKAFSVAGTLKVR